MPKAKKIPVKSEPIELETPITPTEDTVTLPVPDAVDHIDIYQGETLIRTYHLAVHGPNFTELAHSFLAGHPHCHKQ